MFQFAMNGGGREYFVSVKEIKTIVSWYTQMRVGIVHVGTTPVKYLKPSSFINARKCWLSGLVLLVVMVGNFIPNFIHSLLAREALYRFTVSYNPSLFTLPILLCNGGGVVSWEGVKFRPNFKKS